MHPNTYISAVTTFYGADKRDNCFAWATAVLSYLVSAISCCKTWITRWLLAHKNRRTGGKQPRHEYGWEDIIMATQLMTGKWFYAATHGCTLHCDNIRLMWMDSWIVCKLILANWNQPPPPKICTWTEVSTIGIIFFLQQHHSLFSTRSSEMNSTGHQQSS